MSDFLTLLITYLFGGVTFIPLVLCLVLLHAHLSFPHHTPDPSTASNSSFGSLRDPTDDDKSLRDGRALEKKLYRDHEKDVAEGYFAVCREYVPGGVNGKPPMRTTPAGQVIAGESPSVYQSMYRSLFDRKQAPSIEPGKSDGAKPTKRARNLFYVVLRHGHLMLYDDAEQIEVRHVISLAHHDVSIYGGGNEIPEEELWIKRNAIRLSRKASSVDGSQVTLPFYFFSENCGEKEDFYFALLQNQERNKSDLNPPPLVEHFEVKHIISLVQRLHSSEEQLQTRWINALIGRLFLGIYKTAELEDFVRVKITKKIARVKKPAFLSGIIIEKIDLGESAPFITNPRLKDLTVEGDCCVEADVKYEGGFRLEIAATARIDLGSRFKAREVNMVLAVVIKKLEGHLLVRFKPAPSNRIWIAFETMPHMEMSIEPIVSSRQITYGIILRAIENRIREVVAETVVLPHWDDSPFLDTTKQHYRGGIWVNELRKARSTVSTAVPDEDPEDEAEAAPPGSASPVIHPNTDERSASTPALVETGHSDILQRRGHKVTQSFSETESASPTGVNKGVELPKAIRSKSFASAADPVVNKDNANSNTITHKQNKASISKDAASFMAEISNRSQPNSPLETPVGSFNSGPAYLASREKSGSLSSASSKAETNKEDHGVGKGMVPVQGEASSPLSPKPLSSRSTKSRLDSNSQQSTKFQAMARNLTPSETKQQAIIAAAAAAKNWGWNTLGRKGKNIHSGQSEQAGTPENPIGRGRPLPPPGQPLPRPDKRGSVTSLNVRKRKPVPSSFTPAEKNDSSIKPPTPVQRRHSSSQATEESKRGEGLLVVEAPKDSEPASPLDDDQDGYGDFVDNVMPDEDDDTPREQSTDFGEQDQSETFESNSNNSLPRSAQSPLTSSYGDDDHGLASWRSAQEEEARSKSVWMDEQEHQ